MIVQQYHTLTLVNRDSFSLIISYTERVMMEKTSKLQDTTRIQVRTCVCVCVW